MRVVVAVLAIMVGLWLIVTSWPTEISPSDPIPLPRSRMATPVTRHSIPAVAVPSVAFIPIGTPDDPLLIVRIPPDPERFWRNDPPPLIVDPCQGVLRGPVCPTMEIFTYGGP